MLEDIEANSGMMTITRIDANLDDDSLRDVDNNNLAILPTRNLILFPGITMPVGLSRNFAKKLAEEASEKKAVIGIVCQKRESIEHPTRNDLEKYGVYARVLNVLTLPNGANTAIVQALQKFRVIGDGKKSPLSGAPLCLKVKTIQDLVPGIRDKEFIATVNGIKQLTLQIIDKVGDNNSLELAMNLRNIEDPVIIVNLVATMFPFSHDIKTSFLICHRIMERANRILTELGRQEQLIDLTESIKNKARTNIQEHQKTAFLQEQLSAIREELFGEEADDVKTLKDRLENKIIPDTIKEQIIKEIDKLDRLNSQGPDYSVQYNYLDFLLSLPWGNIKECNIDLNEAERILNTAHYGLNKIKERILEQLAVIINNPAVKSPIICLVGPPGVGKTSVAKSIATALGRDYQRVSLGGIHDEAEIRGHRRTYVGALPGRIIDSLKRVSSNNPVIVLDEIDKIGKDYKGDPSSALLEVLDPEQNSHFHDNYLDLDYDLSKVLFIATANTLSTLPRPLLDRMEVIELSGYATEEKLEIAKRHILEKVRNELGINDNINVEFTNEGLTTLIEEYTRESGVRQMEKQISSLYRKLLTRFLKNEMIPDKMGSNEVRELLGISHLEKEKYNDEGLPGVVTGLAWTAVGGDILNIETTLVPGKGDKVTFTGNLGDIMKESATVAYQFVRSQADSLKLDSTIFDSHNIHIHVPEGAVPKDGPSAGITLVTGIVSALSKRKVKSQVAMTGEVTLTGKVLPVGGIKEKILAAKRAGIKTVILSEKNKKDIEEIPSEYISDLQFTYVGNVNQVLESALENV